MKSSCCSNSLLAVIGSGICLLSVNCGSDKDEASWWRLESQRVELGQQLALKAYKLSQASGSDHKAFDELNASVQRSKEVLANLQQRRDSLESELTSYESQLPKARENFLRDHRQKLIGKSFESLKATSGREYKSATVAQIDDAGVVIRHEFGSSRIRVNDLDSEQQRFFGLDKSLAIAAEAKERQQGLAYEEWVDKHLTLVKDAEKQKTMALNKKLEADKLISSERIAKHVAEVRDKSLALSSASVGSRLSRSDNSSSRSTSIERYYNLNSVGCVGRAARSVSAERLDPRSATWYNSAPVRSGGGSACPPPVVIDTTPSTPAPAIFSVQ